MNAKEKLSAAIEKLLEKKELDKITVAEIVKEAAVWRKTFYRNFTDKYALTAYYFSQFFDQTFGQITCGESFDAALLRYLAICESKAAVLKHAYASSDINGLRSYDIKSTKRTYEKYLLEKGADIHTAPMQFAIEIAARGGTDMIIEWLVRGMPEDKAELQALIKRTLPNDLLKFLE